MFVREEVWCERVQQVYEYYHELAGSAVVLIMMLGDAIKWPFLGFFASLHSKTGQFDRVTKKKIRCLLRSDYY